MPIFLRDEALDGAKKIRVANGLRITPRGIAKMGAIGTLAELPAAQGVDDRRQLLRSGVDLLPHDRRQLAGIGLEVVAPFGRRPCPPKRRRVFSPLPSGGEWPGLSGLSLNRRKVAAKAPG